MRVPPDHSMYTIWLNRLRSALQITIACAFVGSTSLYGPSQIRHQISYPSFAYMTAVLLVSEANLGDALRGTWEAMVATCLVVGPTMVSLWLVGPARFSNSVNVTASAVAVSAMWVALLKHVPLMSKKLAFGQIIVVYVGAAIHGAQTDIRKHPLHVAASTATGALAAVIASLLPLPRLATYAVRKQCTLYAENASQRLHIELKPFLDDGKSAVSKTVEQTEATSAILQSIKNCENGMGWEKAVINLFSPGLESPTNGLKQVETTLRGIGMASAAYSRNPDVLIDEIAKDEIRRIKGTIDKRIQGIKNSHRFLASSMVQPTAELPAKAELPVQYSPTHQSCAINFLFFCMKNLNGYPTFPAEKRGHAMPVEKSAKSCSWLKTILGSVLSLNHQSIVFALKCSLSLGLSVLLGLSYNKENGYWSGLAIAIGLVSGRQATLTIVNARAQGTAIGSVYAVLASFVFHNSALRLVSLLPWIIFTSFLRHSKTYGEAGSTTAIIGALLILGRKYSGTSSEFAIARLAEAFIGLSCFIVVEVLLRPERAANSARAHLSQCFRTLRDSINSLDHRISPKSDLNSSAWLQKTEELENMIEELSRFIDEAKVEPNLWFKPFQGDWYSAQLQSIIRITDLLGFLVCATVSLIQGQQEMRASWDADAEQISMEVEIFKGKICSSLEYLEEVTTTKSTGQEENESATEEADLENGKPTQSKQLEISSLNEADAEDIQASFVQHSSNIFKNAEGQQNAGVKRNMQMSLSSLGFCMSGLITELNELEKEVEQLSPHDNHQVSTKL
ncbi:hypothetical protein Droror1_Dr00008687 [Drosera rotundifolia]